MRTAANFVDVALKVFALGLVIRALLSWVTPPAARKAEQYLDRLYNPFLAPLRKLFKPLQLNTTPPSTVDLAPLVLLFLIWWFIHPFAMWLLS